MSIPKSLQIQGESSRDQPQIESTVAPQSTLSFSPIYVEPGSTPNFQYKGFAALYPNSFDRLGDMYGEYDI